MPHVPSRFVEVYRPAHHAELALLRPALDAHGFRYYVRNEFASIGARAATGADELSLMVAADQAEEARAVVAEVLGPGPG